MDIMWIALAVLGVAVTALAVMGMVIAGLTYQYQRAKLGKPDPVTTPVDDTVQGELAELRKRVATLEKLVTDEDRRVASEISRLDRGGPQVSA